MARARSPPRRPGGGGVGPEGLGLSARRVVRHHQLGRQALTEREPQDELLEVGDRTILAQVESERRAPQLTARQDGAPRAAMRPGSPTTRSRTRRRGTAPQREAASSSAIAWVGGRFEIVGQPVRTRRHRWSRPPPRAGTPRHASRRRRHRATAAAARRRSSPCAVLPAGAPRTTRSRRVDRPRRPAPYR